MMSLEQCSRRFDFLRLHQLAWQRRLIRKPRSMAAEHIDDHLMGLTQSLATGLMKEHGLRFNLHREHEAIQIEVTEMATWIAEVKEKQGLGFEPQLILPSQHDPNFRLSCREGRVSCAAASVEKLDHDLTQLAALSAQLVESFKHGAELATIVATTPFGQVMPKQRKRRAA